MAIFQDNILKQEELNGGFEPHSDGDESFLLNTLDSYPADLPDFNKTKLTLREPVQETQINDSEVNDDSITDSDSIWDIFDESNSTEISQEPQADLNNSAVITDDQAAVDYSSMFENPVEEKPIDYSSMFENLVEEKPIDYSSMFDEPVEEKPIDYSNTLNNSTEENPDESVIKEEHEEIGLVDDPKVAFIGDESSDDEFEKMLRQEMLRDNPETEILTDTADQSQESFENSNINSVVEKSEVPEIITPIEIKKPEPVLSEPVQDNFKSVDDMEGAKEFDLSSVISASHPSTLFLENTEEEIKESPKSEKTTKAPKIAKEKKVKEPKPIKEKKERKPIAPILKKIGFIAAIVLISIGLSGGLYYFGVFEAGKKYISHLFGSNTDSSSLASKNTEKKETTKHQDKQVENHKSDESVKSAETIKQVEPNANKEIIKQEPTIIEESKQAKPVEEKHLVAANKIETPKVVEKNSETKKVVKITKQNTEPKNTETKNIVKTEPTKIEKKKEVKKVIIEDELYSIQIYASPSKEDANEWVQKLKKKKLGDVYISTQVIRDKVWYRVRCGYFKTKELAKSAADHFGFSQSWIDRIK